MFDTASNFRSNIVQQFFCSHVGCVKFCWLVSTTLHAGTRIVIANSIVTIDTVSLDARKPNISRSAAPRFYFSQYHDEVLEFLSGCVAKC